MRLNIISLSYVASYENLAERRLNAKKGLRFMVPEWHAGGGGGVVWTFFWENFTFPKEIILTASIF